MMKKSWFINLFCMSLIACTLLLSGCAGSDGDTGAPGEQGAQGEQGLPGDQGETGDTGTPGKSFTLSARDAHAVSPYRAAEITEVTVSEGTFSLTFTVPDAGDVTSPDFTIAKWVPEKETWISMLLRGRQRDADDTMVVRGNNFRIGMVSGTNNTFTYTFLDGGASGDPIDFREGGFWTHAAPVAEGEYGEYVAGIVNTMSEDSQWDENAIYRVGVTGFVGDASYDMQYYTAMSYLYGNGAPVAAADIPAMPVNTESCYSCHGANEAGGEKYLRFHAHGGMRGTIDYCYTCHGDYAYDSKTSSSTVDGWASINMETMVHKIHSGMDGYSIDRYSFEDVRFSDWLFGRGVGPKNCTACHKGAIPAGGDSWNAVSHSTCSSCHADDTQDTANGKINFSNGDFLHLNLNMVNTNCELCHSASSAAAMHGLPEALDTLSELNSYEMEVVSVSNAVNGAAPVVTWRAKKGGVYQDLFAGADTYDDAVRVSVGWGYADDFTNEGSGNSRYNDRGRPFAVTVNTDDADPALINTVQGADSTYAVTTFQTVLPAAVGAYEADGFGFVAVERGPSLGTTPSTVKKFTLQAAEVTAFDSRRQVVSTEKCLGCHTTITRHGTSADHGVETCITCHNAGSVSRDAEGLGANDGAFEGTVDFMFLMHAVHSVTERSGEFEFERQREFDYYDLAGDPYGTHSGYGRVTYPKSIKDCAACHTDSTENFPVDNTKRLGVVGDNWKTEYDNGGGVTAPNAAVCYSCHQLGDPLDNGTIKAHFTVEGGNMVYTNESHIDYVNASTESCMICHE